MSVVQGVLGLQHPGVDVSRGTVRLMDQLHQNRPLERFYERHGFPAATSDTAFLNR